MSSKRFLVVNPRAGAGSPTAAELKAEAERRGVAVRVLGSGEDAQDLAQRAAESGAEALGIAGGDGSLAAVASVALERDLPFVNVPLGTRNHFARDLGLDPDDPFGALAAFGGDERRVDVGCVGDRLFLNNVSLGLYASFVHDPRRKTRNRLVALLRLLPAALGRGRRPLALSFDVDGRRRHDRALLVVVANNDYGMTSLAELGERERLDEGLLYAYVIRAVARRALVGLLGLAAVGRIESARGWEEWAAPRFTVEASHPRVHAAIDGEPVVLDTPLLFELRPRALRVLLPAAS